MSNGDWPISAVEQILKHTFRRKDLLVACFTHKSYSNLNGGEDNERLEFLGDAVLEFVVSEMLYASENGDEGVLTDARKRLVSKAALTQACQRAGLLPYLRYVGGEETLQGKTASNLFEAAVAGLYLDGGIEAVKPFLNAYLKEEDTADYKSKLQELVQSRQKRTPEYTVVEEGGKYRCTVSALGRSACGEGESKKKAEVAAAKALMQILEK